MSRAVPFCRLWRWIHLQAHSDCWQNSVLCSYKNGTPISLLAADQESVSASGGHCITWLIFKASAPAQVLILWISLIFPFCLISLLLPVGGSSLLLRTHEIRLGSPGWSRTFSLVKVYTLIISAKSLLPCNMTDLGVSGIGIWTSLGNIILLITKIAVSPKPWIYTELILYLIWVNFTQTSMSVPFWQSNTVWTHERDILLASRGNPLSGHPLGMRPAHEAWDWYMGMIPELLGPHGPLLMLVGEGIEV